MSLEDDLKARTSALISQQMAGWVVEIQRAIQGHQASLVRALDDLGETVARYDEKVDERAIAAAIRDVLSRQPPPKGGADYSGLKASLAVIEKGTNLSEVLTHLVVEVTKGIERAAMFIVKSNAAVGWYARGFDHPESIKSLSVPLNADTVFRVVFSSRHATRGHITHSPATAQALARLGGDPHGILAVPLILRDKVAAVLFCCSADDEIPQSTADAIEILVTFAGKVIDVLSAGPKTASSATSPGTGPNLRPPVSAPPVIAPAAPEPAPSPAWGSAPVRSQPSAFRPPSGPPARMSAPAAPPPASAPPSRAISTEDQKAHDDAKRFARLVVSEIKLYNEAKVTEGRRTRDIYERLKEDIERGRQMYHDRVSPGVRESTDYFLDELVRILAGGDASALGPM